MVAGAWSKLLGWLGFGDDEEYEDEDEMTANAQEEKDTGADEESKTPPRRDTTATAANFDFSVPSPGRVTEVDIKNEIDGDEGISAVKITAKSSEKVVPMATKGGSIMSGSNFNSSGNEGARLIVYAPNRFDEVQVLVDHMKAKRPVIVSLEGLEAELAHSMLDFICGATYALEGTMQKVSGNIFLVAPRDVDVTTNMKEALLARDALARSREEKEVEL